MTVQHLSLFIHSYRGRIHEAHEVLPDCMSWHSKKIILHLPHPASNVKPRGMEARKQTRNVIEIAEAGGKLDKFVGLSEDLTKLDNIQ